ncbi:glycosyltransferase family 4 protein [Anabaena cylindrica FACHB-243]|uniref:Glycosyl transferase group 1 n=1 Tax=Anabaena cylindrica (strain ATCC 27899 / PCC 7122) TaxID=272123 RepID=K9ZJ86_ANACC|nr:MULTISPECIES: glycosyltransferase family 4 protein [Anabaena]AFZ58829.1 glycosyl transferase group 1 [Anabaena cylindrica PCC 7122]MBD2416473.1 glycosyltransferase family 4 protein [Anabaena cylindrica FACHB-243]MBY5282573.1 glycosyltransferase family 4 protein [Anabaena sp. CCAP 1446/1C]MBY5307285.1 glycosyltransferase family 4 protein [Anabaena sp. CCAP 1446/1C]MCM2409454.1 glycosyltransferase family 4 protein [Anabaena sp. CCAP 1446/1C]
MKNNILAKNYIFFINEELPKPEAHLVQSTNAANGAANLDYATVLVYPQKGLSAINPWYLARPFQPQKIPAKLVNYYNLQDKLKVAPLPMPWPIDNWQNKITNSNTIATKYYLPLHIKPTTQLVHSRNWNFIKAAIKNDIPAIYEHHHHDHKKFEPEIVKNPLFQIAITVVDTIRETMIENGMPPEKVITLHNGFNRLFMERQPEKSRLWREKLLQDERTKLVVYAGALKQFKGIDILIEVAREMPNVQFACAGGKPAEVEHYQQLAKDKQVENITFLGYILHNELSSLLQAADILAHPHCLGKAATFTSPLKLFDYLASGNPVVATEIPSLTEFKNTPAIAAWCEPDNPTKFAAALQQVLATHPKKIAGYPEIIDFVKQFSWENRAAKILSHIDQSFLPQLIP